MRLEARVQGPLALPQGCHYARYQQYVQTVVIEDWLRKSDLGSSYDTQSDELSNHTLNVKPCLKAKGLLQELGPD